MNKFFVLLNVSLRSMLLSSTNSRGRSKRKAATGLGAVFLIAFLGLYLSGLYSYMLMKALAPSNMEVLVFVFMGIGALVGGLLFTTFAVKGVVFGGKDNDLLLSMPVPTTMLMASRVTAIYLENLLFAVFVLVPAGVICTFLTQNGVGLSLLFWMRLGIAVLALPLLDTALSVLLGALVAFLSVRVSRRALGQNIVMGIFMAAVFYFSFHLNGMINSLAENAAGVKNSLTWAAPMLWMGKALWETGKCCWPLSCAACSLCPGGNGPWPGIPSGRDCFCRAVRTEQLQTHGTDCLRTEEGFAEKGNAALFWYAHVLLECRYRSDYAAGRRGSLLVMRDKLLAYVEMAGYPFPLLPMAAAVIGFWPLHLPHHCAFHQPGGKYLWILRESPIEESSLLWVKVGFQLLLTLPCTVIAGLCISIAFGFSLRQGRCCSLPHCFSP